MEKEQTKSKAMEINEHDIPWLYAACIKSECQLADSCLRTKVWQLRTTTQGKMMVVNPTMVSGDKDCKEFRSSVPMKYAVGFKNFREQMYPRQYRQFMSTCISHWSRNEYYLRRRGEKPIPPKEQRYIKRTLKACGVTQDLDFDGYTYDIDWDNR